MGVLDELAIAQIGKLPSTLADRSIGIEMRRRTWSEKVMRFRNGRTQELGQLARMAARWVADNDGAIREREPDIPKSIFNRAADNWEPLLAIWYAMDGERSAEASHRGVCMWDRLAPLWCI
jgi:putative DNA primase/helicase